MRDPNRIEPVLEALRKVWTKWPDLRFMQLVLNAMPHKGGGTYSPDPYFLEDDRFLDELKSVYSEVLNEEVV